MSLEATNQNRWNRVRADALQNVEPGTPLIMPWRMEANQDQLHKGQAVCGCGCSPDDPEDDVPR